MIGLRVGVGETTTVGLPNASLPNASLPKKLFCFITVGDGDNNGDKETDSEGNIDALVGDGDGVGVSDSDKAMIGLMVGAFVGVKHA